jgi:tetratricopeptide (TPR) repeat protein
MLPCPPAMKPVATHEGGRQRSVPSALFVSAALALLTLGIYWPVSHFELISYDDPEYITWNLDIQGGLTLSALRWAFSTGYAGNWHPLTWVSYMLDYQFFGGSPGQMHLTSLVLHLANTLVLFSLFRRMTGTFWRSAFVAAIFALHPLHVESVAWVCERKDVLSTFFGLLSLGAYVRYVQSKVQSPKSKVQGPKSEVGGPWSFFHLPSSIFYLLSLALFAFSLMSKPMLVTLPCVLLLLDYWPLQRLELSTVFEKLPFFALTVADSIVTFWAQKAGGAVVSTQFLPVSSRVANALMAYLHYLRTAFWPAGLSISYPATSHWPFWQPLCAAGLLLVLTGLVLRQRQRPYLFTGWFWFLGTLVPVIGLTQIGAQTVADRFMYFPLVGLAICVAWGSLDLFGPRPAGRVSLVVAGTLSLVLCAIVTHRQVCFWKDGLTLFSRALAVTKDNFVAHDHVGMALNKLERHDEAIQHYREAVRICPVYAEGYVGLAFSLGTQGHLPEALACAAKAVQLRPDSPEAHDCLGVALQLQGKTVEAETHFVQAVKLRPSFADARNHWAYALLEQGRIDEAIAQLRTALRITPDSAEFQQRLSYALSRKASANQASPPQP